MKTLTAKERTISMFAGTTFGEEQRNRAPRIVDDGPTVSRIALTPLPAMHFRFSDSQRTLCGVNILAAKVLDGTADLGVCQSCRAEASRLRARVGR